MAVRVKLVRGSYYEDQDGKTYVPGETFETDSKEAAALILGGSAIEVDAQGRPEDAP